MDDVGNLDLYGLLELKPDCTEEEIVKAYRKKARRCHPDKNPDDPNAARLFRQISKALEVLGDAAARAAYDRVLHAKHAAAERNAKLDAERKKLKEDLEARERAAMQRYDPNSQSNAAKQLAKEVDRLRKAGSKLLEAEKARLAAKLNAEKLRTASNHGGAYTSSSATNPHTRQPDARGPEVAGATTAATAPAMTDSEFADLEMAVLMRLRQRQAAKRNETTQGTSNTEQAEEKVQDVVTEETSEPSVSAKKRAREDNNDEDKD